MRITREADYAIRIVYCLCPLQAGERMGTPLIAEKSGVRQRFILQILRQLMEAGIVISYKGACGGYALNKAPSKISVGSVIEVIDGPICINHCLSENFECSRVDDVNTCCFHNTFLTINEELKAKLYSQTFDKV